MERVTEPTIHWLLRHGPELGFRPPTIDERSRAMGATAYLNEMGLSERALFDGQGNAFDRGLRMATIGPAITRYLHGDGVPSWTCPSPDAVAAVYNEVKAMLTLRRLPTVERPVPPEVELTLRQIAAETGRGGQ